MQSAHEKNDIPESTMSKPHSKREMNFGCCFLRVATIEEPMNQTKQNPAAPNARTQSMAKKPLIAPVPQRVEKRVSSHRNATWDQA